MSTCTVDHSGALCLFSSLDPPETNAQPVPRAPPEGVALDIDRLETTGIYGGSLSEVFRHSCWARQRALVFEALKRTHQSVSRCVGFSSCGHAAYVLRSYENPPRYRVAGSSCHDRFCVPCANERSRTIALNVIEHLGYRRVRFLTLTLRQSPDNLGDVIDRLYGAFRKLQRSPLWSRSVTGGVAFLEIKFNPQLAAWNCHLHLLVEGKFIPQNQLSHAWHLATGDSFVVDIRLPAGHAGIIRYVTKYASKPLNSSFSFDPVRLDEAISSLKGRRLCTTFGTWRTVLLLRHPDEESWENLGSLEGWISRAAHGDPEALDVLRQVHAARTDAAILNHSVIPRPPPATVFPTVETYPWLIDVRLGAFAHPPW